MNKTIDDVFRELIKNEGWYKNSNLGKKVAWWDKNKFLSGENISYERKKKYLQSAGYEIVQEEYWNLNSKTKK